MNTVYTDVAIVGAGSAGLSAAIQAARAGARVLVIDENAKPGGQLFKQIHKFFGSREHRAGVRGFLIGQQLLEEVEKSGAEVWLDSTVYGIFQDRTLGVLRQGQGHVTVVAKKIILAAGAKENYMAFPGSTLPGVMGAGAAQTMINVNRVLPGRRILMVGSGNVGLIVSYQLMQAGAEIVAIVEAAPKIGGYGVHAGKIRRAGVPILTGHTVLEAYGHDQVEGAVIASLDESWKPIAGSEEKVEIDTLCLAVGLNPMSELAWMAGCQFELIPALGGQVPLHDEKMETTVSGLYVAGDITGVEEASSAMEEGNLAGLAAAESLGLLSSEKASELQQQFSRRLDTLRSGMFGARRREAKAKQIAAMQTWKEKHTNKDGRETLC